MSKDEAAQRALQAVLTSICERLEQEAREEHPDEALAAGEVHGLLSVLAMQFLTQVQQRQVERVLVLHCQCLYGVVLEREARPGSCS